MSKLKHIIAGATTTYTGATLLVGADVLSCLLRQIGQDMPNEAVREFMTSTEALGYVRNTLDIGFRYAAPLALTGLVGKIMHYNWAAGKNKNNP